MFLVFGRIARNRKSSRFNANITPAFILVENDCFGISNTTSDGRFGFLKIVFRNWSQFLWATAPSEARENAVFDLKLSINVLSSRTQTCFHERFLKVVAIVDRGGERKKENRMIYRKVKKKQRKRRMIHLPSDCAYLRKAYSTGLTAEFEYPKHPTSTKIVISNFDWHTSGGELIRAIWLTWGFRTSFLRQPINFHCKLHLLLPSKGSSTEYKLWWRWARV